MRTTSINFHITLPFCSSLHLNIHSNTMEIKILLPFFFRNKHFLIKNHSECFWRTRYSTDLWKVNEKTQFIVPGLREVVIIMVEWEFCFDLSSSILVSIFSHHNRIKKDNLGIPSHIIHKSVSLCLHVINGIAIYLNCILQRKEGRREGRKRAKERERERKKKRKGKKEREREFIAKS